MPESRRGSSEEIRAHARRLATERRGRGRNGPVNFVGWTSLIPEEGEELRRLVLRRKPERTLEIGFAYGVSTLYIASAQRALGRAGSCHWVVDPFQLSSWEGAGLLALEDAGARDLVHFVDEESQLALPRLARERMTFDFAFVDGNHRFDTVVVDLSMLERLVVPGGTVVIDDVDKPAVAIAVRYFTLNRGWTIQSMLQDGFAAPSGWDNPRRCAVAELPSPAWIHEENEEDRFVPFWDGDDWP